jgi:hypothetical protein
MIDRTAWLCVYGRDEFFFFPDSGRVLPSTISTFRSFLEDGSFFVRWQPLRPNFETQGLAPDTIIASRVTIGLSVERPDLWILSWLRVRCGLPNRSQKMPEKPGSTKFISLDIDQKISRLIESH